MARPTPVSRSLLSIHSGSVFDPVLCAMLRVPVARSLGGGGHGPRGLCLATGVVRSDGPFACVECDNRLALKIGRGVRRPHFAHREHCVAATQQASGVPRTPSHESAEHAHAKILLADKWSSCRFVEPDCRLCGTPGRRTVLPSGARAMVEHGLAGYRADVMIVAASHGAPGSKKGEVPLAALEVVHTHSCEPDKIAAWRSLGLRVLEIDAGDAIRLLAEHNTPGGPAELPCRDVTTPVSCDACRAGTAVRLPTDAGPLRVVPSTVDTAWAAAWLRSGSGVPLRVPHSDKDLAKRAGATWDPQRQGWFACTRDSMLGTRGLWNLSRARAAALQSELARTRPGQEQRQAPITKYFSRSGPEE